MTHHPVRFNWFRTLPALAALTVLVACSEADKEATTQPEPATVSTNAAIAETVIAIEAPTPPLAEADTTEPTAAAIEDGEDAIAAWAELVRASRPPNPPEDWQGREPTEEEQEAFRQDAIVKIRAAATLAQEFVEKYPESRNAGAAKLKERDLLSILEQLGDSTVGDRLSSLSTEMLNDGNLSDEQRFQAKLRVLQQEAMKLQSDMSALSDYVGSTVLEMRSEHPDHPVVASLMMEGFQISKSADNTEMADRIETELWKMHEGRITEKPEESTSYEIILGLAAMKAQTGDFKGYDAIIAKLDQDSVPEQVTAMLENLAAAVAGERAKFDRIGKEVELNFTAIDGTEFDLRDLRGKVVLIDFWATWCGPCIVALPEVKVAYEKLHGKGFEIVGISLDEDLDTLKQFIARQKMPWVQYFDGKGWGNEIARHFGISSIPATWLVDKEGKLREIEVRGKLVKLVEGLLDEQI